MEVVAASWISGLKEQEEKNKGKKWPRGAQVGLDEKERAAPCFLNVFRFVTLSSLLFSLMLTSSNLIIISSCSCSYCVCFFCLGADISSRHLPTFPLYFFSSLSLSSLFLSCSSLFLSFLFFFVRLSHPSEVAFGGVLLVCLPNLDWLAFQSDFIANPSPYPLALLAAITWGVYGAVTSKLSREGGGKAGRKGEAEGSREEDIEVGGGTSREEKVEEAGRRDGGEGAYCAVIPNLSQGEGREQTKTLSNTASGRHVGETQPGLPHPPLPTAASKDDDDDDDIVYRKDSTSSFSPVLLSSSAVNVAPASSSASASNDRDDDTDDRFAAGVPLFTLICGQRFSFPLSLSVSWHLVLRPLLVFCCSNDSHNDSDDRFAASGSLFVR